MSFAPIAAAGLQATGYALGGAARGASAQYQAAVARNNAVIARQNQEASAQAGAVQTEQASLKARVENADVRAGFAGNNIDVNRGSAADVQAGQREIGQLDAETVARNAALQSYGYGVQSSNYATEAKVDQAEGRLAPIEGLLEGAGSFIGNANVDSAFGLKTSLLNGRPSVPDAYKWMQGASDLPLTA